MQRFLGSNSFAPQPSVQLIEFPACAVELVIRTGTGQERGGEHEVTLALRHEAAQFVEHARINVNGALAVLGLGREVVGRTDPDRLILPVDLPPGEGVYLGFAQSGTDGQQEDFVLLGVLHGQFIAGGDNEGMAVDSALVAHGAGFLERDASEGQRIRQIDPGKKPSGLGTEEALGLANERVDVAASVHELDGTGARLFERGDFPRLNLGRRERIQPDGFNTSDPCRVTTAPVVELGLAAVDPKRVGDDLSESVGVRLEGLWSESSLGFDLGQELAQGRRFDALGDFRLKLRDGGSHAIRQSEGEDLLGFSGCHVAVAALEGEGFPLAAMLELYGEISALNHLPIVLVGIAEETRLPIIGVVLIAISSRFRARDLRRAGAI